VQLMAVFTRPLAVYQLIPPSRGPDVLQAVLGDRRVNPWVCDGWSPQLQVPAERGQLCLAHQIRNRQGLIERCPHLRRARERQALFRTALLLANRRPALTGPGFQRRVTQLDQQPERLLERPLKTPTAQALLKRYRKHRDHWFVFWHDPRGPFHNNACERDLRPSVVHRKVTRGFRSRWGADA
jgi:transposase